MEPLSRVFGFHARAASALLAVVLMEAVMGSIEVPSWMVDLPRLSTNRCSDYDLSGFTNAMNCGPPLSLPCFDFSRCRNGSTIYIYDEGCSLADSSQIQSHGLDQGLRLVAKEMGVLADTYEGACLFINVDGYELQCATTAPLWNEGRNHVMFDLFDESRDHRPSYSGSYAMEASTSQHSCYYRSGYDISLSHCPKVVFHGLQSLAPDHRRYFLTFRGTLHLLFHGSEERASIMTLHDESQDVIVAQKCVEEDSPWRREAAKMCDRLLTRYHAYDYSLLMNSTFGLIPAGASPGTYRLPEVMSAGCIPVFVVRDYVKPFTEEVDWSKFSFTFSPEEVPDMLRTLRAVTPLELRKMQKLTLDAYWKIYGGENNYTRIIHRVIDTLVRRIEHHES